MTQLSYSIYDHINQQETYKNLNNEIINLIGVPIRYIPKKIVNPKTLSIIPDKLDINELHTSNNGLNYLYGEDVLIKYDDTIPMKMILSNYDSYGGIHNLFSKITTLTMEDEISLEVELTNFINLMSRYGYTYIKPEEGDIISFDLGIAKNNRPILFEIKYADEQASYFTFGTMSLCKITCSLWQHSHEKFNTPDEQINSINNISIENILRNEIGDNEKIEQSADEIRTWNPKNPFGDPFSKPDNN